ncbi:SGNH/GDSL hydrolase family protein [Bacteroides acidifaciens]|uniref:SGNH/GDSL hydrolase family protein n=1 Tax=Bacteroides acidifaciens TaxID=85831 RepID=UPI00158D2316|nr:SGNH/GDSL hydrolase family protein [Bacteroides acidifaciens]MDE6821165.1 SGNH/GDSL hydrolase family protein [Bacteroides acidifaciens]
MKIIKNYLTYSLWLVLTVFAALLGLHWLPAITVDGHTMRRVDLLSDLRYPDADTAAADSDSIPLPPVVKPEFVDTCRAGMTCIEDYSDSTYRGMAPFYEALDRVSSGTSGSGDNLVRIAVFGDSFIEADIFTADLREMLQKRFGGCGVGFVTITSMTSGYRPTVRHMFSGWSSHAVTDSVYFDRKKQGISGHYFVPRNGAYVELRGQNKYASLLDTCQRASIFFYNKASVHLSARVNRGDSRSYVLAPSKSLQEVQVDGRIGSIRWTVDRADSTLFYGLAMDGKQGIILDNFSLRGSSGLSLRGIPQQMLKEFNRQRPYDLIILEYGLNVATERGRNYDNYQKGLLAAIEHLKTCFPQAGILLLSVGDRDYKNENGDLRTMPGVKNLIRYQQNIAAESGIAFWNMFEAMGGDGSMAKLVHAKPSMANYDYTHINFRGGKHLAGLLYETLIYGKEQYDRRKAYEKE